jgi:hypothetical protein
MVGPAVGTGPSREKTRAAGVAHKEPRENKARVGLPMVAERVVEQDLPQCATAAPSPRCRLHVVSRIPLLEYGTNHI